MGKPQSSSDPEDPDPELSDPDPELDEPEPEFDEPEPELSSLSDGSSDAEAPP